LIKRNDFNLAPKIELRVAINKRLNVLLTYNNIIQAPSFEQILPIADISNPLYILTGNPNLKSALVHRPELAVSYNDAIHKLNLSLRTLGSFTQNKVVNNQILIQDQLLGLRRQTSFANVNGDYTINNYYTASKTLKDNKYILKLNGNLTYNNSIFISNGLKTIGKSSTIGEELSLSATPTKWLDINPNVKIEYNQINYSLAAFSSIKSTITEFNVYGNAHLTKLWLFGFDMGKSLVSGISTNITNNPFIINFNFEKRMFKNKDAILSLAVMDMLKQNNFISRSILTNGFVDSKTNTNSRYFLLQFSWSPQKFTAGNNAGKRRQRDGSFAN
jgi:hypothetical protein